MRRFAALGLALACSGCIPAPDLAALAADHNAICIRVTTPWGTSEVSRNHGCEPAASIPTTSVASDLGNR